MQLAKTKIMVIIDEVDANDYSMEVRVPEIAFPIVVGTKGSVIREIERESGATLDLNRGKRVVVVRGK